MVAKRCLKTLQSSDITIFTHTNSFPLRVTDTQTLTQLTLSCTRTYPHSLPRRAQSHIKSHSVSPLHTHTQAHALTLYTPMPPFTVSRTSAFSQTRMHSHSHTYTHSRSRFGHACSATLTLTNRICSVTCHSQSHSVAQTFPDTLTLTRTDTLTRAHTLSSIPEPAGMRAAGGAAPGCPPLLFIRLWGRRAAPRDRGQGMSHRAHGHARARVGWGAGCDGPGCGGVTSCTPAPRPPRPAPRARVAVGAARAEAPVRAGPQRPAPHARRAPPPTVLSWAPMVATRCARSAAAAEIVAPPRPGPAPPPRHPRRRAGPRGVQSGRGGGRPSSGRRPAPPACVRRGAVGGGVRTPHVARGPRRPGTDGPLCGLGCDAGLLWASFASAGGGRWRPLDGLENKIWKLHRSLRGLQEPALPGLASGGAAERVAGPRGHCCS